MLEGVTEQVSRQVLVLLLSDWRLYIPHMKIIVMQRIEKGTGPA